MNPRPKSPPARAIPRSGSESLHPLGPERRPDFGRRVYPASWLEWTLLVLVFSCGAWCRGYRIEVATVEHFDEGVYASNLWFGPESDYQYPMRYLYAPPMLPALIEWTMVLTGAWTGGAALWPALVSGCATILVVWWVARQWFGPAAAITSACLAAFSDVHVVLSRSALTDCLLLLLLVLAIGCFERAWHTRTVGAFVTAGAATGLAWWAKYNGWLPFAVGLAGGVASVLLHVPSRNRLGGLARGWLIAGLTILLVWSPVWFSLQRHGGYSAVAANHRRYVVGLRGWPGSLTRQVANLQAIDGMGGNVGWTAALVSAWLVRRLRRGSEMNSAAAAGWKECGAVVALAGTATLLSHAAGGSVACVVLGGLGLVHRIWRERWQRGDAFRTAGVGHASAWFLLLALLTPLYTPYVRLVLPLLGASWLAAGLLVDELLDALGRGAWCAKRPAAHWVSPAYWCGGAAAASFVVAIGLEWGIGQGWPVAWRDDRRGLETIATQVRERLASAAGTAGETGMSPVVYVYGEPALLFHLRAKGLPFVLPVNTVELAPAHDRTQAIATFLIVGLHAQQDDAFRQAFARAADRFSLQAAFPYAPSLLVQLDHRDPRQGEKDPLAADVLLYRVQ